MSNRADLAAAFRWAAREGLHETVANHFSLALGGGRFLLNPRRHFARMRASDLWEVDAHDPTSAGGPGAPDATAWGLHGAIHARVPHAACVMHLHPPYATAVACLADPALPPLDQNAAMFFDRHAVDRHYGGLALHDEGTRIADLFQDPKITAAILQNHGVIAIGRSVAEALYRLVTLEAAARTVVLAAQTGRPLAILPDDVARRAASQIDDLGDAPAVFLAEIRAILDAEDPSYAD